MKIQTRQLARSNKS